MEKVTWKLMSPNVKQIGIGNLLYGSGNSNRVVLMYLYRATVETQISRTDLRTRAGGTG